MVEMRRHCLTMLVATAGFLAAAPPQGVTGAPEPSPAVQGTGSGGVTEVGRPLDVLRPRAEAEARERALEDLVRNLTGDLQGEALSKERERIAEAARGREARWEIRYWTCGAVTATVTLPADTTDLQGQGGDG